MKVGIVHNSLNTTGGGERLCLKTIEAIKEIGAQVVLATVEPTDWDRVERIVGKVVKPDEEISLLNFKIRMFGIYIRLLTFIFVLRLRKICDIIINTHGDVLPIKADVIYMHYPTFALLRETPINIKYSDSLFWKTYFIPYEGLQRFLVRKQKFIECILLTNSTFSKIAIKKHTKQNAIIIYPPVEVKKFEVSSRNEERENIIVGCGRYTPEKNYEFFLNVAAKFKDKDNVKFVIIGASSGVISKSYYEKLNNIKMINGLKNVELLKDLEFSELLKVYRKAKIYLHGMRYEHFGISVVEAMAAGLVPVVHRSGGPWMDILRTQQGLHGYSYVSEQEAADIINKILENELERKKISENNLRYVSKFSDEEYKKSIVEIIKKI